MNYTPKKLPCAKFLEFFCTTIERMKPILEHAIEIEGSRSALARAMGVAPSVVTYWSRKLPRKREDQLIKLYGKRKRKEWSK